ncbi:MAG: zinc ribbon domain-containing protein, partial [Rubrivivax sp.]|nr:zinc ribbon domain-containing protein [Rubrivivax sp.]
MGWCPKCHHLAEAGSRFCSRCGEVLPHRRCPSCGTANDLEAWHCVECGSPVKGQESKAGAPGSPPAGEDLQSLHGQHG